MNKEASKHVPKPQSFVLLVLFFISGICGLSYQLVWARMFASGFGHEIPSTLAVIAAFFGGLALGSWLIDKRVNASSKPGHWYAALELVIGSWAVWSVFLIPLVNAHAAKMIGLAPSFIRHWGITLIIPFIVLLPCTMAMGATFPAMERAFRAFTDKARCVGSVYAANTLGAVAGVILSTVVLMPQLGFRGTLFIMTGLNLLCAASAWRISCKTELHAPEPESIPGEGHVKRAKIAALVFATGLFGIGYEVLAIRMMSQVWDSTIYSFAGALVVYLTGTSIGAAVYQRTIRKRTLPFNTTAGFLLCGVSTACLIGMHTMPQLPSILAAAEKQFPALIAGMPAAEMGMAIALFALPTILMGMTFTHLMQAARDPQGGLGNMYALNALGGALSPFVFSVVLLPVLGFKWALLIVAAGYLFVSMDRSVPLWLFRIVPIALALFLPRQLDITLLNPDEKQIDYKTGIMASVTVQQDQSGIRRLSVNNKFNMGGTGSTPSEQRQALLPLLLHPNPENVLFLGVGTGITVGGATLHPGLHIQAVEIIPEMLEMLPYFEPENQNIRTKSNIQLYAADARWFIRATTESYDVIVGELFQPARDGAGSLYTLEHFQAIKATLKPDGLFCQWMPLHQINHDVLKIVTRTFLEVFPNADAFLLDNDLGQAGMGLVGRLNPAPYPADWFQTRIKSKTLLEQLKRLHLEDNYNLFGRLLLDTEALKDYSRGAPLNTDNHPVVIFEAPKYHYSDAYRKREMKFKITLDLLKKYPQVDPMQLLQLNADAPNAQEISDRFANLKKARRGFIQGAFLRQQGDDKRALSTLLDSVEISRDYSPSYFFLLDLAKFNAHSYPEFSRGLLQELIQAHPQRPEAEALLQKLNP